MSDPTDSAVIGADGGLWVAPEEDASRVTIVDLRTHLPFCFGSSAVHEEAAPITGLEDVMSDAEPDAEAEVNSDVGGSDAESVASEVSDFDVEEDEIN